MSVKTWRDEFYQVPAALVPVEEAAAHSLRKWRGLTKENLAKHGLSRCEDELSDSCNMRIYINAGSCALCEHYIDDRVIGADNANAAPTHCPGCPLSEVRGCSCDIPTVADMDAGRVSPYDHWIEKGDPASMINALEAAAEYEKRKTADAATESHAQNPC